MKSLTLMKRRSDMNYNMILQSEIMTERVSYVYGLINNTIIMYQLQNIDIPEQVLLLDQEKHLIYPFHLYENEEELALAQTFLDQLKAKILPFHQEIYNIMFPDNQLYNKVSSNKDIDSQIDQAYTQLLCDKIINDLTYNKQVSDQPIAFITAGQSGAGKTSLRKQVYAMTGSTNFVMIDNDYIKKQHPLMDELALVYGKDAMDYIHPIASKLAEQVMETIVKEHYNIIFEATCKNVNTPVNAIKRFKNNGYCVKICVVAVHHLISKLGIYLRYETLYQLNPLEARNVPEAVHDEACINIANTIDYLYSNNLVDQCCIFTRTGDELYNSEVDNTSPLEVLSRRINDDQYFDQSEYDSIKEIYNRVKEENDKHR